MMMKRSMLPISLTVTIRASPKHVCSLFHSTLVKCSFAFVRQGKLTLLLPGKFNGGTKNAMKQWEVLVDTILSSAVIETDETQQHNPLP
jgi:hypothetical protein